jgi:hypothetical protein
MSKSAGMAAREAFLASSKRQGLMLIRMTVMPRLSAIALVLSVLPVSAMRRRSASLALACQRSTK